MNTETAPKRTPAEVERHGLRISVIAALGMAALGIGFAIPTDSRAVLLDGVFSLVGFAVGLVAIHVATLVLRRDDEHFHFGYSAHEPMLNLTKGLLIAFVGLLAAWSSIESILDGGRQIAGRVAVVYAVVAAAGCLIAAFMQRRLARQTSSPLLEVDSKNWLMDGLMSGAVAVAFAVVVVLEGTSAEWIVPYADPSVVLLLVVLSLPIPISIIRTNWNQLLGRAPDRQTQREAEELVADALGDRPGLSSRVRLLETGRLIYLHVYVIVDVEQAPLSVQEADAIRESLKARIDAIEHMIGLDVIFTADRKWADLPAGTGFSSSA